MNMNPKISIITVCYNSEKTIERTISSVITQSYRNYEYIIIDGLSSDKTMSIVKKYSEENNIFFISEKDNGIYNAMNKGISFATGDIICLLNSDDWLEKDALKIVANNYNNEKYCVWYGMERRILNEKEHSVGFHSHNFLEEGNIPHQTCYVTRKCYEDFGTYNEKYKSAADYEFMLRIYLKNKVKFIPIYKILVNFTEGGVSAGAIGYVEEAKIKYKYKIISRKKYLYLRFRTCFLKLIKQLK